MDEVKDNIKVLVIDTSVTEKSWRWYRSEKSSGNIWIRGIPRREERRIPTELCHKKDYKGSVDQQEAQKESILSCY